MPIPDLKEIRGPALQLFQDGKARRIREVFEELAPHFSLTPEEKNELLPSGKQSKWHNRVNWACFDLSQAGLLTRPKKGVYVITDTGRNLAKNPPPLITRVYLIANYPAFADWIKKSSGSPDAPTTEKTPVVVEQQTPQEIIAAEFKKLQEQLKLELLELTRKMDPYEFQQLIIDLLLAMGYGGSREEAAQIGKRSNDEGIDGLINEDRLGLDRIYVQAKRWTGKAIGRPDIQAFVGALAGKHAQKGIFITTSEFADNATNYAQSLAQRVILVDGQRLAELMIEHNIGVARSYTYEIKRVDGDYFEDS